MTTVLKERMSEGLRAERAPSDPPGREAGRRLLCQKYTCRHIAHLTAKTSNVDGRYVNKSVGISRVGISLFNIMLPTQPNLSRPSPPLSSFFPPLASPSGTP